MMRTESQQFTLLKQQPLVGFKNKLKKEFALVEEPPKTIQRIFYDSFDWRVFESSGILEAEIHGGSTLLSWSQREDGQSLGSIGLNTMPQFVWDFPIGPFRDRLESILEARVLLPQITIKSHIHSLKLLNKDKKTVLRLFLEENTLLDPRLQQEYSLGKCLRMIPVRGYKKPYLQVLSALSNLKKRDQSLFDEALKRLDIHPKKFSSKLAVSITPDLNAETATKRVYTDLFRVLKQNETGLREDWDSEFLHDFRVSIRRIRSGLGQIKKVFPPQPLARFKKDFAWLGQMANPLRDLDVYLLNFDGYRARLPEERQKDLAPLYELLRKQKQVEHQKLVKILDSSRYRRLLKDWEHFLKDKPSQKEPPKNARLPISKIANEHIFQLYQKVLHQGQAIRSDTPEEALHDLRKTCKKLRYLMEFFQSLYPKKEIKTLIQILKRLQENLGDFHDFYLQWSSLGQFGTQLSLIDPASSNTFIAVGMLIEDLKNRQNQARLAFGSCFKEFASSEHQKRFKRLFLKQ
ncbi:MAG: CHAD domain-containing protein [SAR324 cluster bacterium]|nr:CHAD domain-containing protein [SAR324 cluster bacterium]